MTISIPRTLDRRENDKFNQNVVEALDSDGVRLDSIETITWIEVTFENSWVNFGSEFNRAAYCKDCIGFIHLRGTVKDGIVDKAIFTLPIGYRPSTIEIHGTICNSTMGRINITTDGVVLSDDSTNDSNAWLSLDGITFYAG